MACCWRVRASRTQPWAATSDTWPVTSGLRIASVTSWPLIDTRWAPSALVLSCRSRSTSRPATALASAGSTPAEATNQVTARYMAPVSR